jgi:hypothetical protein
MKMSNNQKKEENTHSCFERGGGNHPGELSVLMDRCPNNQNYRLEISLVCDINLWKFQNKFLAQDKKAERTDARSPLQILSKWRCRLAKVSSPLSSTHSAYFSNISSASPSGYAS